MTKFLPRLSLMPMTRVRSTPAVPTIRSAGLEQEHERQVAEPGQHAGGER